jgi:hypothetical protein
MTSREIYLLVNGQVRNEETFQKNITLYNRLLREHIVTRVIVSTWMHEHPPQMKSNTFTYLELPKVKDAGHGNWIAQMTNFKHGMKYIQAPREHVCNENASGCIH